MHIHNNRLLVEVANTPKTMFFAGLTLEKILWHYSLNHSL